MPKQESQEQPGQLFEMIRLFEAAGFAEWEGSITGRRSIRSYGCHIGSDDIDRKPDRSSIDHQR